MGHLVTQKTDSTQWYCLSHVHACKLNPLIYFVFHPRRIFFHVAPEVFWPSYWCPSSFHSCKVYTVSSELLWKMNSLLTPMEYGQEEEGLSFRLSQDLEGGNVLWTVVSLTLLVPFMISTLSLLTNSNSRNIETVAKVFFSTAPLNF